MTPFVFNIEIFNGFDMVNRITIRVIVEEFGGNFLKTTVGGEIGRVIEGVAEIDFVKMGESGGKFVVVIIDCADIWLPERESEVGVGGE